MPLHLAGCPGKLNFIGEKRKGRKRGKRRDGEWWRGGVTDRQINRQAGSDRPTDRQTDQELSDIRTARLPEAGPVSTVRQRSREPESKYSRI
jgi:hypothetical protein